MVHFTSGGTARKRRLHTYTVIFIPITMQTRSSNSPVPPRRSQCPTKANRAQALNDFHRRNALHKRDEYVQSRGYLSEPGLPNARRLREESLAPAERKRLIRLTSAAVVSMPDDARPAVDAPATGMIRSRRIDKHRAKVSSPIRKKASPAAMSDRVVRMSPLQKAQKAVDSATALVEQAATEFNETMGQATRPADACKAYRTPDAAGAGPSDPSKRALQFICSMADMATGVERVPADAASAKRAPARQLKGQTVEQRVMTALERGIQIEKERPTHGKDSPEHLALNGLTGGAFFVHLPQFYTRMPLVARQVRDAAARPGERANATPEQVRTDRLQLERLNAEALALLPGMKAKIRGMVAAVDQATAFLAQAASSTSKKDELQQTRAAIEYLAATRMALLDLQQGYEAEGSAFAQAHASFEAIQRGISA